MSTTTQALPGYNLAAPTVGDALTSLARLGGPDKAREIWSNACRAVGVPPVGELSQELLEMVCKQLKTQGGMISVIGGSLLVRVQSHALLSNKVTA